jgi:hypothetical protein
LKPHAVSRTSHSYGAEIVYRPERNNAVVGANAKAPRPIVDNIKTVQRLQDLGALNNQDKQSILALKAIVDEQIKIAIAEKERIPSAVGQSKELFRCT